jgi:DNA invertase Pin-like site-specific DNA recombinase
MTPRVYSYKRFSSPKQAKGDSLRRQSEFEQEVCRETNLPPDDSLNLTDRGVSAWKGHNKQFGALARFLELVRAGRIPKGSVLAIENIDRLTREKVLDAIEPFRNILNAGIAIHTRYPRLLLTREEVNANPGLLMTVIWGMVTANEESSKKSVRVHGAWKRRRERAATEGRPYTKRCPAWLQVVDGRYELIPERAEAVRFIFRHSQEGLGATRLIRALEKAGHKPFTAKGWNEVYIKKLLKWPAVYGEFQAHQEHDHGKKTPVGPPQADYFPAVVTKEEFLLARAAVEKHRHKGRPTCEDTNLFTRMVHHAGDGCPMHVRREKHPEVGDAGRDYLYLVSSAVKRGKPPKGARTFPYPVFEQAVLQAVAELQPSDVVDAPKGGTGELDEAVNKLTARLATLEERYRVAEKNLLDPDCTTPAEELNGRLNLLSEAIRGTREQLQKSEAERLNCRAESLEEVQSLLALLDRSEGEELARVRCRIKARLDWLVREIWVHIEKVNHVSRVAHIQIYLRMGAKRYLVVHAPTPAPDRPAPAVPRSFRTVDLRTLSRDGGM